MFIESLFNNDSCRVCGQTPCNCTHVVNEGLADTIKRGVKQVKRGMQGWTKDELPITGTKNSPRDIVNRTKGYDDKTLQNIDQALNTPIGFPFRHGDYTGRDKHSPAGLQKRVVDRELRKRGIKEEGIDPEQKFKVTYDVYGSNREVPLYTKSLTVRAHSDQEAIDVVRKLVGGRNHRVEKPVNESENFSMAETIDVDAIHAEMLHEHLLSDPALYENNEGFQDVRNFLNTHATVHPSVSRSYIYVSVHTTPMANYFGIAYFKEPHRLVKLDNQYAYFNINGDIKRFPESKSLTGDALSQIFFFESQTEFEHFISLLNLKFSDYKISNKILDQSSLDEDWEIHDRYHKEKPGTAEGLPYEYSMVRHHPEDMPAHWNKEAVIKRWQDEDRSNKKLSDIYARGINEESTRIAHLVDQLRALYPEANSDIEAILLYVQDAEENDRSDIGRLDAENDAEEANIDHLEKEVDDIKRHIPANESLWNKAVSVAESKVNGKKSVIVEWADKWYKAHGGRWV